MIYSDTESDTYTLSTGKTFYANCGIIGIAERDMDGGGGIHITEGYDGGIPEEQEFTPAERKEIAIFMIELWARWSAAKSSAPAPRSS